MFHSSRLMDILGVRVDNLSKNEILEKIDFFLDKQKFFQVATVNPEFILLAQKDEKYKSILNQCALNIADGIGLKYAFIRNLRWLKKRFTGVDLVDEILKRANEKKLKVFIAVNESGLTTFSEIKEVLEKKYSQISISGRTVNPKDFENCEINECDVLLCNFGAPYQELFLNAKKDDTMALAIGIGGTFDFFTGKIKRAPKLVRILGFEWLYRLIQEPGYRFKRIINAVLIFPIKVLVNR